MATPSLSLDHRIGLLRRRRRLSALKQVFAVVGPVLGGIVFLLLLAGGGVIASAR
ncbi:MAG TPA: hypothetical protein VGS16_16420 [Candidatus Dormibacteraeota bacterium]|nr:hypothetical protein [Candidatus Dormibacteraeota bacterium]